METDSNRPSTALDPNIIVKLRKEQLILLKEGDEFKKYM